MCEGRVLLWGLLDRPETKATFLIWGLTLSTWHGWGSAPGLASPRAAPQQRTGLRLPGHLQDPHLTKYP